MSRHKEWTKKEIETLKSLREQGYSQTQIGQRLGRHQSTILRKLRKLGITSKVRREPRTKKEPKPKPKPKQPKVKKPSVYKPKVDEPKPKPKPKKKKLYHPLGVGWTKQEIKIIKSMYESHPLHEISKQVPGRNKQALKDKIKEIERKKLRKKYKVKL